MNTIADRVRARRNKLGLSQKELAKKIGVSQGTIGQLESGRNNRTKYIYQLATALAVDVQWLLDGNQAALDETGKKVNSNNSGFVSFPDVPIQFYRNFICYITVNAFLIILNAVYTPEFWWVVFPAFFWGIGIVKDFLKAFVFANLYTEEYRERKIAQEMEKMKT